ncbi:hypothetical protein PBY51_015606 [Eleginops maclovinus]|uniref:Uncharacterized protein n=1 Tax=Eleginops maclovinus TaxID=56733 RepID=A0AAN8ARA2_ELEMC|nr:hypothetical protein PBY51_015606 [Eleginops maclovinus]
MRVSIHPARCLLLIRLQTGSGRLSAHRGAARSQHQSPATISRRPARQISSFSAIRHTLVPCPRCSDVQSQRSERCLQALLVSCQSESETLSKGNCLMGGSVVYLSWENSGDSFGNSPPTTPLPLHSWILFHSL